MTTVKGIVEAQEYLFENLWKNAIPAQYKIKEIVEGIKPTFTEILRDPLEIQKLVFDLVVSAKEEILMLLFRDTTIGNTLSIEGNLQKMIELLKAAVIQNEVRVRILASNDIQEQIERLIGKQNIPMNSETGKQRQFEIHPIDVIQDQHQRLQTRVSILIVDSKSSLIEEPNTGNKESNNSNDDLALATYSNSESTLLAYISIFETFWTQTELKPKSF
ncbi:MAG: hypothetical protein ACTHKP_09755 [Nitrososphaeraceae archaeon]